jgi:hypothetical protein
MYVVQPVVYQFICHIEVYIVYIYLQQNASNKLRNEIDCLEHFYKTMVG